jgi:hypothetical protein
MNCLDELTVLTMIYTDSKFCVVFIWDDDYWNNSKIEVIWENLAYF